LKNREPLQTDSTGGHLRVAFDQVPGPGARTFCAKTMRRLPFPGPGGPTVLTPDEAVLSLIGATGRSPDRPAASCGSRSKPPGRGPARPMLFVHKLLAPGPRPKHRGNVKRCEFPRQSRGFTLRKLPNSQGEDKGIVPCGSEPIRVRRRCRYLQRGDTATQQKMICIFGNEGHIRLRWAL